MSAVKDFFVHVLTGLTLPRSLKVTFDRTMPVEVCLACGRSATLCSRICIELTFAIVESNVEVPLLPIDSPTVQFERYALGLSDVDWLEIVPQADGALDRLRIVVCRRCCVERTAFLGYIDVNDFLCLNVVDGAEIERVSVLEVVDIWTVVHQCLLKS